MAVRGLTGLMMAGPMEQTEFSPYPYQEVLQRNQAKEQLYDATAQSNIAFMDEMDSYSTIPGTKDEADMLTKPYLDRMNKLYDASGGDLSQMAAPMQQLTYEYYTGMSDAGKRLKTAGAAYKAQQASLQKGVEAGTYTQERAGAILAKQTQNFNQNLEAFKSGEIDMMPQGAEFAGSPVTTPDITDDMFKIQEMINKNQISSVNMEPIFGPDGQSIVGYKDVITKREYTTGEGARELTNRFLNAMPEYSEWANEAYDLGLVENYNRDVHGSAFDLYAQKDPTVMPLSEDPGMANMQMQMAGVETPEEYNEVMGLKQNMVRQQIAEVGEEQAGASQFRTMQREAMLDDIAAGSGISEVDRISLTSAGTDTNDSTVGYNIGVGDSYTTQQIPLGDATGRVTNLEDYQAEIGNKQARYADLQNKLEQGNVSPEETQAFTDEMTAIQTDLDNLSKLEFPLQTGNLKDKTIEENIKDYSKFGSVIGQNAMQRLSPETKEFYNSFNERAQFSEDDIAGYAALHTHFNTIKNYLDQYSDVDLDRLIENYSEGGSEQLLGQTIPGDVLRLYRDYANKFERFENITDVDRQFTYHQPSADTDNNEFVRTQRRSSDFLTNQGGPYMDMLQPDAGSVQELYADAFETIRSGISGEIVDADGVTKTSSWAPQLYVGEGLFEGKPYFVLDPKFYKVGNQQPQPIPFSMLNNKASFMGQNVGDYMDQLDKMIITMDDEKSMSAYNSLSDQYIFEGRQLYTNPDEAAKQGMTVEAAREMGTQRVTQGVGMQLNAQYLPTLQASGIETATSSIITANNDEFEFRVLDPKMLSQGPIKNKETGELIFDPNTDQLRVERKRLMAPRDIDAQEGVTAQPMSETFSMYFYRPAGDEDANLRISSNMTPIQFGNGETEAPSLESLIYRVFEGDAQVENILSGIQRR